MIFNTSMFSTPGEKKQLQQIVEVLKTILKKLNIIVMEMKYESAVE